MSESQLDAAPASGPAGSTGSTHSLDAVRNALKLGSALLVTLAMSFGVRVFLPRFLGPDLYGMLKFAESFTTGLFVVLGLGLDTYIRRDISLRPEHASDFLGGILLSRFGLTLLLFGVMAWLMHVGHRSAAEQQLVYVYGAAQLLVTTNTSLSALLHAKGEVDGLSVSNVATKALWGVLIAVTLYLGMGGLGVAVALVLSEAVEVVILAWLVQKHLGWKLSLNARATLGVVIASLPFFLNTVAHTVYSKMGVTLLAFLSNDDAEVGRYGAAADLAGLTLLITPLIGWVLMPLYSRAQNHSDEEFNQTLRRSLEFILTLGFPVSLMLGVGADIWMRLAFGAEYESGALALRILAPLFLLTYVAMVAATVLINLNRSWTLTVISLVGLAVNPLLNVALIRLSLRTWGSTGGGAACALADTATELLVTGVMLYLVGRRAFDRRSGLMLLKTTAVCAGVVVVDRLVLSWGPWRLLLAGLVYTAGVLLTGALKPREILEVVRAALRNRKREQPI